MSDPVVEAARKAWEAISHNDAEFDYNDPEVAELVLAVRMGLDPIRKLHDDLWDLSHRNGFSESHQDGMRYVLHELSKHIFTSEELER